MPTIPSIKGSVFAGVIEDIRKLLAADRLKRAELSRWLKPKDVECLDSAIQMHEWYDIRTYTRMSELLRDVEGEGQQRIPGAARRGQREAAPRRGPLSAARVHPEGELRPRERSAGRASTRSAATSAGSPPSARAS